MLRAIERGLTLADFENLTFGMIVGFITQYNNDHLSEDEEEEEARLATQADMDRF